MTELDEQVKRSGRKEQEVPGTIHGFWWSGWGRFFLKKKKKRSGIVLSPDEMIW